LGDTQKKILTDVDGVLLNWEDAFTAWMAKRGYSVTNENHYNQYTRYNITKEESDELVSKFNESAWIGWLRPLRDATLTVPKFIEKGFSFECITSLSDDYYAGELRKFNLRQHFNNNISACRCIAQGADKDDILKEYEPGHWWIEDKPKNCEAGLNAGHRVILINHSYNEHYKNKDVYCVNSWSQIYQLIVEGEYHDSRIY